MFTLILILILWVFVNSIIPEWLQITVFLLYMICKKIPKDNEKFSKFRSVGFTAEKTLSIVEMVIRIIFALAVLNILFA